MPGRTGSCLAVTLAGLILPHAAVLAAGQEAAPAEGYPRLVERYRAGDTRAAQALAAMVRSGAPMPRDWCHGREECEAAAVLNLEAAAVLHRGGQDGRASALLDATRALVGRQATGLAFDWLLAAAALRQACGDHARAFELYTQALDLQPRDPSALLGQTAALEFSAIPDGFGGVGVSDQDIWGLLRLAELPLPERWPVLANPRKQAPPRKMLLEHLTRQYRHILDLDGTQAEARLRLGRVLQERGRRAEAEPELRAVSTGASDPFIVAVARLCLARSETSPARAAAAYRSALDVDPTLSPAWLGLARALLAGGDREAAMAAVEHALSPEQPHWNTAWVSYHTDRGRVFPQAMDRLRARVAKAQ